MLYFLHMVCTNVEGLSFLSGLSSPNVAFSIPFLEDLVDSLWKVGCLFKWEQMAGFVYILLGLSLLPKYRTGAFNTTFIMLTGRIYWINISLTIYII